MYARDHFLTVMNLDFKKPTQKMVELAKQHNLNLKDP